MKRCLAFSDRRRYGSKAPRLQRLGDCHVVAKQTGLLAQPGMRKSAGAGLSSNSPAIEQPRFVTARSGIDDWLKVVPSGSEALSQRTHQP